jgi:integrase
VATKTVTDEVGNPDMASTAFLLRRGDTWYYNRAYPKDLWPTLGKAPFRKSLRTDSLKEAQRARPEAERLFWQVVDRARAGSVPEEAGLRPLTNQVTESLAAETFRRWLSETEEFISPSPSPQRLDDEIEAAQEQTARARERLATGDFGRLIPTARSAAERAGYEGHDGQAFRHLLRLLGRAEVAHAEVYEGRLLGDYGARPGDPLFASILAIPANSTFPGTVAAEAAPPRTIADLEVAYRADKWDGLSTSARMSYEPVFRLLKDVVGPATPLSSISREDGRRLFEAVKALPSGLGKRAVLNGLSVPSAIEAANRLQLPRLSAKTVNDTYMGNLSAIFGWAVREGWIDANPVAGLRVAEEAVARAKRDPFTSAQLSGIFSSPPWHPRGVPSQPIRYWAPLIALFQGMRRGEIAQLRPEDFEDVDDIPALHVRGERLKSQNALRTLPVHPKLIALGLPEYVKARREAGDVMLFPGARPNSRGQWGDEVGDWFGRRVKELGLQGRRLGMHSFRHNFEDALRRAGLHGTAIGAELAGRSGGSEATARAYGSGFAMADLRDALAKVHYPGLRIGGH